MYTSLNCLWFKMLGKNASHPFNPIGNTVKNVQIFFVPIKSLLSFKIADDIPQIWKLLSCERKEN